MKKQGLIILGGLILSFSIIQISYSDMRRLENNKIKDTIVYSKANLPHFIEEVQAKEVNNLEDEEEPEQQQEETINEITEPIIEKEERYLYSDYGVCHSSNVKTYMNYKAITNTSSTQYKFIQNNMYVDQTNGLLRYNNDSDFIGVALGSSFGEVGSMYRFTLDTGIVLNLIKVEAKADNHTNNGCEQIYDKSVIEFVIDSNYAKPVFGGSNGYVANGNFNNISDFKGNIIKIEKVTTNE